MNFPQQGNTGKGAALVQLICFLVLFLGIYLIFRRFVHAWDLRLLILIADYAAVSLITFVLIKPLTEKTGKKSRKK